MITILYFDNLTGLDLFLLSAISIRDKELESLCNECDQQNRRQMAWILTRIKQAAPQALVVPS